MIFTRNLKIAAAVAGAVAVAGGVVVVTAAASGLSLAALAASPSPSPKPSPAARQVQAQAACDGFISHVAGNLKKSDADVRKAMSDALNQSLADAVKKGNLTQTQADAIKARNTGGGAALCTGVLGGLDGHKGTDAPGGHAAHAAIGLDQYAKALGIPAAELKTDLAGGQTIKQIAATKGINDEAGFRTKLLAVVKTDLDAKVKAATITQAQEDAQLAKLQSAPVRWDQPVPAHKPKPQRPAPSPSPAT